MARRDGQAGGMMPRVSSLFSRTIGDFAPMSRKHFNAIAAAIAEIRNAAERKRVAELLATVCAAFNSQFDRARFFRACGVA